ncbi:DUF4917 family protein [Halomonas alkaliantarctica]|uniref:DUF4917 family protein n=1 Tax=Halomonas alkaliantarctica TaxID=232346 RepID=A0ABY8LLP4_9GAMM|nr:DUF4917 family protein [Halomonas alkaliantarctica]WGI24249.1 DUF4917 family protein [Halomonas alkaliantarctica]
MKIENFNDVLLSRIKNRDRDFHLLLGNGFSMAYDPDIFSYNALHSFIEKMEDEDLSKILNVIETKNFELIMQNLDSLTALIGAFDGGQDIKNKIKIASEKLKVSLLDAVRSLHPEHVFKVPEDEAKACAKFLNLFLSRGGSVFSTNYDLLLYWILMRSEIVNHVDGCGREILNYEPGMDRDDFEWSELFWGRNKKRQNVFYVHGALPFFDAGSEIVKEEYSESAYLLQKISTRMERGEYPIFVTAGSGDEKLTHIMHNHYLSFCFDKLSEITGTLVTFGFNFGEYDRHIVEAINRAAKKGRKEFPKLVSVYIGVYSEADKKHIEEIEHLFMVKVRIFDAKTVDLWGRD